MKNVTRRFSLPAAVLLIAGLIIPSPAQADCAATAADTASCSKKSSEQAGATDRAQVPAVIENEDGSVSIKIKNVEILRVDENGIRINGNIEYTHAITDIGPLPQDKGATDEE